MPHEPNMRDPASRPGATLIELLVTLVLITVGVLGLAATSALVARQMDDGWRQALATATARSRLELLAATVCDAVVTGASTGAPPVRFREAWTVGIEIGGARAVRESVSYEARGGPRAVVLEGRVPCRH